jgi:hypothetical protein
VLIHTCQLDCYHCCDNAARYGIKQVADDLEKGCNPDTETCASGGKVISSVFGVLFASMQVSSSLTRQLINEFSLHMCSG